MLYSIRVVIPQGDFHFRKEVVPMSTYEELMVVIGVAMLIVAILSYVKSTDDKDTKK